MDKNDMIKEMTNIKNTLRTSSQVINGILRQLEREDSFTTKRIKTLELELAKIHEHYKIDE